jgi:putative transposase
MLACDLLTVETAFLQRIYALFFISHATRRIEYIACTPNPDGRWVAQQARNLLMQLGYEHPFRFLVHDRDTKFSHAFDEIFRTEGIKVIRTPVQAPNANAFAERWVRTLRTDCLDRILILGRRHLEHVLRVYRCHYNEHRPHRALHLLPPNGRGPTPLKAVTHLRRRDLLASTSATLRICWRTRTNCDETRRDGEEFMELAPKVPVRTQIREFRLEDANEALQACARANYMAPPF